MKRPVQLSVPLSRLVPSRGNPRKVNPSRESHERLVALIRSQSLLQPLVVRPIDNRRYEVVAGHRRLRALREIHGKDDVRIPCMIREVDAATADALSLGENFGREAMHPLDEAEAFAKLATTDGKDAQAIAAEFGVSEHYVRQHMKLATLAEPVKAAHREGTIDTATAEAFAAVPEDRQLEVWKEVSGHPRHAGHVRNVIANAWIDATHALFDLSTLPELSVSRDLFADRLLVERQAFMEAQTKALDAEREKLHEEGWAQVVVARREDAQDRLYAMNTIEREFDEKTSERLAKLADRREKLEAAAEQVKDDEVKLHRLRVKYEAIEAKERDILQQAPQYFSEETKAVTTAFLLLDPDGEVHREYRMERLKRGTVASGGSGRAAAGDKPKPPNSDELSDKQLATTFTHQAMALREALLANAPARHRVLALLLHEKLRSEALALRHEPNAVTLHALSEGFHSRAFEQLQEKRAKLDPFEKQRVVDDVPAYEAVRKLSASKLDALITLLTVDCITAHLGRQTQLIEHLSKELKVNVRDHWRPDAAWLSSFQKFQLAHLITDLKGPVHAPAPERKKSELVQSLAKLFTDAADGKPEDKELAGRVNAWLPSNLRQTSDETVVPRRKR